MPDILIEGVIGWEVDAKDVRDQLNDANGKDVVVKIASPGGLISEGLNIFNILKNYSGNVDTHLMGQVASMGTYIAMVGEKRTAEKNAVFMIHNGSGMAWGDHREFFKFGKHLDSLTNIIAKEYTAKTGTPLPEIRSAMDDETFYYGDEIKEAGFVHEIVGDEEPEDKADALAFAQLMIDECNKKINTPELVQKEIKAFCTMMDKTEIPNEPKKVKKSEKPDNKKQEVKTMTKAELKEKFPDVYNAIYNEGKAEGVETGTTEERGRVKQLVEMRATFKKPHSQKVIDTAIAEGHDIPTLSINLAAAAEAAEEVVDAIADGVEVPGGDSDDTPEMVDDQITNIDHVDAVAKKTAELANI